MKLPTVKQLRYFVALTETEHFGRAAEACFVSQSAFSNAIQELESLLEVQLVDRTNRSVTITAMGQQVATQARLCLRDVESLVEMAHSCCPLLSRNCGATIRSWSFTCTRTSHSASTHG